MIAIRTAAVLLALPLALAGCMSPSDYSASESPKTLTVSASTTRVDVRFVPGSAQLAAADSARLRSLAATGAIAPSDRVTVAAAGEPALAKQRVGAVAATLLPHQVVVDGQRLPQVAANHATIEITRALVTLPPCPNWSRTPTPEYTNSPNSNFGCATAVNLGLMVASPLDLVSGRPLGTAAGQPAVSAMNRYLTDKVELPTANTSLPIASSSSSGTPNTGGSQ